MAFEQHRDKNGEMSRKRGNTLIRTLRKHCRAGFPAGCADTDTLGDVLYKMDEPSFEQAVDDHEGGKLEQFCKG